MTFNGVFIQGNGYISYCFHEYNMTCRCEKCKATGQKRVVDCLFVNVDVNLHIARQTQLFVKVNSWSFGTMAESCWESSSEGELFLTQSTVLGSDTPELRRNTVLFVLGNCFALRARQDHRNLRMKNSQLSLHTDESGVEYLQYVEDVSKSSNAGLTHLRIKNKVVRAYENVEKPERCPVKLYKKYISHVPLDT